MTLSELNDGDLLDAFRAGDEEAFVELYRRRRLELYRFILATVNGDRDMASDMFQDTIVKIHQKAHTLRNQRNIRAWMYTIARNTCLNAMKVQGRLTHVATEDELPIGSRHPQPDALLEQQDLNGALRSAIAGLAENQRQAILLREFDGFSYAEIARITDSTVDVVRQRLWRAKQTLRSILASRFDDSAEGNTR